MTPHNEARIEEIAPTVLMPGDPLRATYIAKRFLTNVKLVNSVRNMYTYTGTYNGKRITVFPSGMGMPSMGIYCYELYKFYNVQNIIRIGSCGVYTEDLNLFDTILVDKSYTPGNFALALTGKENHLSPASSRLNQLIKETSIENNIKVVEGSTLCTEVFDYYCDIEALKSLIPKDIDIIAAEMEAFALFSTANLLGKNASCLLSVVDSHAKKEQATVIEREQSLNNIIELALKTSLKL